MKTAERWLIDNANSQHPSVDTEWIKQIQLDAVKEGMRRAADISYSAWNQSSTTVNQKQQAMNIGNAIESVAHQLTIEQLQ